MGFARAYRSGDEYDLAPRLRQADLQEIQAASGRDPVIVLREGAERSVPSCTIMGNTGYVAGMFGVVPEGDFGRIWMVGSEELTKAPLSRQFLRECRDFVNVMERPYLAIGNYIDERNTVHIRWLRWLGFIFIHRHENYGFEKRTFLEFIKCVNQLR
jgi:scaffold protein Gp13